jgi:hypothetical protein
MDIVRVINFYYEAVIYPADSCLEQFSEVWVLLNHKSSGLSHS